MFVCQIFNFRFECVCVLHFYIFCIAHRKVNGKYFVNEWAFMFNENDDDDDDDSNSENGW